MKRYGKCIGKKKYTTLDFAVRVARKRYFISGVKLQIYECPTCLDFHLTKTNKTPDYLKDIKHPLP